MEIFGSVDRENGGKTAPIKSTYPVYYFKEQIEALEEEVHNMKQYAKNGMVPRQHLADHNEQLKRREEKLQAIKDSMPHLSAKDKDKIARAYDELGKAISDLMPTRTDMQKGLASPHDEVAKMHKQGCVDVRGHVQLLRDTGIEPDKNGKINLNKASKAWKIYGRLLGERTSTEYLRKDYSGHSIKLERSEKEMIQDR